MAVVSKGHPWDDLFYKEGGKGTNANALVVNYHESASLTYECLNDRNELLVESTVPWENYPELCRCTCECTGQIYVTKAVTYIGPRTVMRVSGGVQDPECACARRKPLIRVIRHKSELSPGTVEYNAMSLFVTKKYVTCEMPIPGPPTVTFDTCFIFSGCVPAGCYATRGWSVQPLAIANVVGWEFDEATQAYNHVGPQNSAGGFREVCAKNHVFKTRGNSSGGEAIMFNAMPVGCGPVGFDGCGWSLWARSGYFLMSCSGCYQQSLEESYGYGDNMAVVGAAMPWVSLMTGITERSLVSTAEGGVVVGRVPIAVDNVIEYWMDTTEGYNGGNFGDDYCYDSLGGGAPVGVYRCGTEVVAVSTRFRLDLATSASNIELGFRENHGSKGVEAGDWLPGDPSCTYGSLAHITNDSVQLGTKVYPAPVTGGGEPVLGAVVEADGLQYDGGSLSTLGEVKFSLSNDVWERLSWEEREEALTKQGYMGVSIRASRIPGIDGYDSDATDVGMIEYNSAYDGSKKLAFLEYDETSGIATVNIDAKDIFCAGETYPNGVCMTVSYNCAWHGLLSKGEFENAEALFSETCFEGPGYQGCFIPSCYYK